MEYYQAKNIGDSENYTVMFEVEAADPFQRVTVQLLDYSPETEIEKLIIYDGARNEYVYCGNRMACGRNMISAFQLYFCSS